MDLGSSELNSEAFFWGRQVSAQRAAASFARLWAVQIMAHSALTLSMLRRRNWRKPLACLIALDPASDERAKIGLRAIARLRRCFIRVLPEIGFYGIEQWCKLRLIARRVGQRVRHDDLTGAIDGGLCVVALDEAVFGRHHAAVGIGEVALRLVARLCRDGLGLASRPALAAVAGAVVVRLRGSFGFGFSFQRGLGGPDLLQPLLFVGHPLGHLVATLRGSELTILSLVGLGGLSQPALDLRRKPRLGRFHPAIAHRLVDPGIGLDLCAVERHMAHSHYPRLAAQRKNLPEQSGERSQMPLAELADRAEVRTLHPRYCRKIQPLRAAPRDLARRVDPLAVRIKQQRHHHPTMT